MHRAAARNAPSLEAFKQHTHMHIFAYALAHAYYIILYHSIHRRIGQRYVHTDMQACAYPGHTHIHTHTHIDIPLVNVRIHITAVGHTYLRTCVHSSSYMPVTAMLHTDLLTHYDMHVPSLQPLTCCLLTGCVFSGFGPVLKQWTRACQHTWRLYVYETRELGITER